MTSENLLLFILFLIMVIICQSQQISSDDEDEAIYGDIGDEVHTNLPTQIRKSVIPVASVSEEGKLFAVEEKTTTRILKPFKHFLNPVYSRDFIALKNRRKIKPVQKMTKKTVVGKSQKPSPKQLSPDEVVIIHTLHKFTAPSSVHEVVTKKSNIGTREASKQRAIAFIKYLRNPGGVTSKESTRKKSIRNSSEKKPFSVSHQNYAQTIQNKLEVSKQNMNSYFSRLPFVSHNNVAHSYLTHAPNFKLYTAHAPNFKLYTEAMKRTWRPLPKEVKHTNYKQPYFQHKAKTYPNNALLKDLSKVTMKWTGYKAIDELQKNSKNWISVLKSAMRPKKIGSTEQIKTNKQIRQRNMFGSQMEKLVPVNKIKSFYEGNTVFSHKRKMQEKSKTENKKKTPDGDKKKESQPKNEEEKQEVINVMAYRPYMPYNGQHNYLHYQQQPFYQHFPQQTTSGGDQQQPITMSYAQQPMPMSYSQQPVPMSYSQQPVAQQSMPMPVAQQDMPASYTHQIAQPLLQNYGEVPSAATPVTTNNINQELMQYLSYMPNPGVVPDNYYHSEHMADGRIRPALYPIAKHIPLGKCLPESSLCDKGQHEQCCGASTFCMDYWGINKCVAFTKEMWSDLHDSYQQRNNINYKNYYRYLETKV